MRFEFAPTDNPDLASAEALQSIAHDVNRIADALDGDGLENADVTADELVAELEDKA